MARYVWYGLWQTCLVLGGQDLVDGALRAKAAPPAMGYTQRVQWHPRGMSPTRLRSRTQRFLHHSRGEAVFNTGGEGAGQVPQQLVGGFRPVLVQHRGQRIRVADEDAGSHQCPPTYKVAGDPVHWAPCSDGDWNNRAVIRRVLNQQIIFVELRGSACDSERNDPISGARDVG